MKNFEQTPIPPSGLTKKDKEDHLAA